MRSFTIGILHHLLLRKYNNGDIIGGARSKKGYTRNSDKIIVAKPEGKTQHGKPCCKWEDNIKTDLKGTGCEGVD
jgi:hypothetical protein